MDDLLPGPGAEFRWRTCTINVRMAAEHYGPIDGHRDTTESVHLVLAALDKTLFAEDFCRASITNLSEDQMREWMLGVLRAWTQGVTAYLPEPYNAESAKEWRDNAGEAFDKYRQGEIERQREIVERNKPRFERAWAALRELKVSSVFVEFSGEGDSGQIDSIEPEFEPETIPPREKLDHMVAAFKSREVFMPSEVASVKLEDLIEGLSDNLLCRDEVPDWYSNEGGYGTLKWRVNPNGSNTLDITVNQRVIDYDTTVLSYDELGEMTAIDHKGRSN
jgi:hypothetical protein